MSGIEKDIKALVKLAESQGFTIEQTGSKLRWTAPDGKQTTTPLRTIGRSFQNVKTQLRRIGLKLTPDPAERPDADVDEPTSRPSVQEALAVLVEFVEATDSDESEAWASIAEDLQAEVGAWQERYESEHAARAKAEALLVQVKDSLALPSWEVLPRIASLLGVKTA